LSMPYSPPPVFLFSLHDIAASVKRAINMIDIRFILVFMFHVSMFLRCAKLVEESKHCVVARRDRTFFQKL